ncbi:MAG: glycosyltransferase family 39 protein [Anaerolineae bacterium]|nr:glycosyltransferase family 39 protein [Anaerolineae bacterium]
MAKFALHMINAHDYGFFFDELYTIALSRHLAFGYVDLPPLVPALVALNRALLGESLFALRMVPALAGSGMLIFICLIVKEFGGKLFAVILSALVFIFVPLWLSVDSIFCYDSIDQLILAGFLYTLVRYLRSWNRKLWIWLGFLAGLACLTKMTLLFLGPGFLAALLLTKYRKDLLTPWPWLGAGLCLLIVSPYLLWEVVNHWPTLEYWNAYGTSRVYQASMLQYLTNILVYMNPFFLPLWIFGLYRLLRPLNGVNYSFLGWLFLFTLALMFYLHASARMLGELFIPLIAAGAVFVEEALTGARWKLWMRILPVGYLLSAGIFVLPTSLPILPLDTVYSLPRSVKFWYQSIREFNADSAYAPVMLIGRVGWESFVQDVAEVYDQLPPEERAIAGIYTDWYYTASAIDMYGPQYGLSHAVSGSLTYYLWGPGDSWDVMIIVVGRSNYLSMFFDECEQSAVAGNDLPSQFYIYVCRKPNLPVDVIWPNLKNYR